MLSPESGKKNKPVKIKPSVTVAVLHKNHELKPVQQPQPTKCYVNELVEIADEIDGSLLLDQSGLQSGVNCHENKAAETFNELQPMDDCFKGWSFRNPQLTNTTPASVFDRKINYQRGKKFGLSTSSFFENTRALQHQVRKESHPSNPDIDNLVVDQGVVKYFSDSKFQEFYADHGGFYSKTNFFQDSHAHLKKSYPNKLSSWFSGTTQPSQHFVGNSISKDPSSPEAHTGKGTTRSTKLSLSNLDWFLQTKYPGPPYQGDPAESRSIRRALGKSESLDSADIMRTGQKESESRYKSIFDKAQRPNTLGYIPNPRGYIPFTDYRRQLTRKEEILARSPSIGGGSTRGELNKRTNSALSRTNVLNTVPGMSEENPTGNQRSNPQHSAGGSGVPSATKKVRRVATSYSLTRFSGEWVAKQTAKHEGAREGEARGELRLNNTYLVRSAAVRPRLVRSSTHLHRSDRPAGVAAPRIVLADAKPGLSLAGVRLQERPVSFSLRVGRPAAPRAQLSRSHSAGWLQLSPHKVTA